MYNCWITSKQLKMYEYLLLPGVLPNCEACSQTGVRDDSAGLVRKYKLQHLGTMDEHNQGA